MNLDKIRTQIKWIMDQIQCLKRHDCECKTSFNLKTSLTDDSQGNNGAMIISENVQQISAFEEHLEFVNSPESTSGIPGHTILKLSDSLVNSFLTQNVYTETSFNYQFHNMITSKNLRIIKTGKLVTLTGSVYMPTIPGGTSDIILFVLPTNLNPESSIEVPIHITTIQPPTKIRTINIQPNGFVILSPLNNSGDSSGYHTPEELDVRGFISFSVSYYVN